jgi:uncharacterized coiled-coil protein SlyX
MQLRYVTLQRDIVETKGELSVSELQRSQLASTNAAQLIVVEELNDTVTKLSDRLMQMERELAIVNRSVEVFKKQNTEAMLKLRELSNGDKNVKDYLTTPVPPMVADILREQASASE